MNIVAQTQEFHGHGVDEERHVVDDDLDDRADDETGVVTGEGE